MKSFYSLPLRQVFLVDAAGALLSAVVLLAIVLNLPSFFGLPYNAIYLMAIIAACYFIYSITCHLAQVEQVLFLKVIAIMNVLYSILIIILLFLYKSDLTVLGLLYIAGDAVIVFTLAAMEFRYLKKGLLNSNF